VDRVLGSLSDGGSGKCYINTTLTVGRNAEEAAQSPYAIQALTGATVSSRSVCNIVNDTVAMVKTEIAEPSEGFDGRP